MFDRSAARHRVGYIAGRVGLPMIDLTDALERADRLFSPTYFQTDSHWNARGQDVAARALSDFLASGGNRVSSTRPRRCSSTGLDGSLSDARRPCLSSMPTLSTPNTRDHRPRR